LLHEANLDAGHDPYQQQMISLYNSYQAACQRASVVDLLSYYYVRTNYDVTVPTYYSIIASTSGRFC
jgi:hypothetical protein